MLAEGQTIREVGTHSLLEKLGYTVLPVASGREALQALETHRGEIGLVFLDILLPDMDGRAVYGRMMERNPDLKVIVCSGHSVDGPAQEILHAGANGFLQRPYTIAALSEKVAKVLVEG